MRVFIKNKMQEKNNFYVMVFDDTRKCSGEQKTTYLVFGLTSLQKKKLILNTICKIDFLDM